ncbi:MAG: hypothetical protein AABY10_02475 [Nanoarchaeota archaeon]
MKNRKTNYKVENFIMASGSQNRKNEEDRGKPFTRSLKKIFKTLYNDIILSNLPEKEKKDWQTWGELDPNEKTIWESNKEAMKGIKKGSTRFYHPKDIFTTETKMDGKGTLTIRKSLLYSNPEKILQVKTTDFGKENYFLGNREIDKKEYKRRMNKLSPVNYSLTLSSKTYKIKNFREENGEIKYEIVYSKNKKNK